MNLTEARAQVRLMIRDPNGRAISDNSLRDDYINPSYLDWWLRFERRPSYVLGAGTVYTANSLFVFYSAGSGTFIDPSFRIEALEISTGTRQVTRAQWNKVRKLQETEGATTGTAGGVGVWAGTYLYASGTADFAVAFYPVPTVGVTFQLFGGFPPSTAFGPNLFLSLGTDLMNVDPLAARWICRLAAHRASVALNRPAPSFRAILAGMPEDAAAFIKADALMHGRALPPELQKLYRAQPVTA